MTNVFPAHAGVFPASSALTRHERCLPRARGGVPSAHVGLYLLTESSPRTRGCSRVEGAARRRSAVFPAHAGVFP